nr:MAG TPA: hypothetical protein [Caudoviricetes sp.]
MYISSGTTKFQDAKLHKLYTDNLFNLVRLTQIVICGIIGSGGEQDGAY